MSEDLSASRGRRNRDVTSPEPAQPGILLKLPASTGRWLDHVIRDQFSGEATPEKFSEALRDALSRALVQRGARPEDIALDGAHLLGMAVQALKFSGLKTQFVNIMAATLDLRTSYRVLPAHVDVLRQLSPDEFLILTALCTGSEGLACASAVLQSPRHAPLTLCKCILPDELAGSLQHRRNISAYVDNMTRLGLIHSDEYRGSSHPIYRSFVRYPFIRDLTMGAPAGSQVSIMPQRLAATDFAKDLMSFCT